MKDSGSSDSVGRPRPENYTHPVKDNISFPTPGQVRFGVPRRSCDSIGGDQCSG